MRKPWSISTTVRNPDRIRSFLEVLREFEGEIYDEKNQVNFQIKLIQNKLYKPMNLPEKLSQYYDCPTNMSFKQAEEIFNFMRKRSKVLDGDPGFRGRTSLAPLSKMGLVASKRKIGKLFITNLGNKFLGKDSDIGDIFLEYFYKWTLPNPNDNNFSLQDGFNITPFVATIKIIFEVNKKWGKLGEKEKGISKEEFSFFVPTTINYENIAETVDEIISLRKKIKGKTQSEQKKIKKKILREKVAKFFGESSENILLKNIGNLKDYGDNAIRYFKLTKFFYIRGGGFYIDLEPRRNIEIKSILDENSGEGKQFLSLEKYLSYIEEEVIYPWETLDKLLIIFENLKKEILSLSVKLKIFNFDKKDLEIKVGKLKDKDYLKEKIKELRKLRTGLQEYENHVLLSENKNFEEIIVRLENIYKIETSKPIELEYLVTMGLHAINDAIKIQPNYPVGDDNKPTFTAPANVPDIECFYDSFNLICEVTMLNSRDQWINEGQPVMRHLRDFEENNKKESLCIFIAPKIHRDTFNTFNFSNKGAYEGRKQIIIPFSISQFIIILKNVLNKKEKNSPITHQEFFEILKKLYNHIVKSDKIEDWMSISNKIITEEIK